ncbi:MAG: HAD-IC family P-type ATPase [Candidatus Nealsonbacteria bacterium]|nr:HAD-IC family P-type ATPase [Candidatus Nealsonbacteria bacterium]
MNKENIEINYHARSIDEVFEIFSSNKNGLSEKEANKRLEEFGPNEISKKEGTHPFFIFLKQFHSILIYILLFAAALTWYYEKMIDTYVILFIVVVNSIMGFIQEYRAEKAVQALSQMVVLSAKVYRDGVFKKIDSKLLVPGDIIEVGEGDRIPVDARIFELKNFRTVESSLTGESNPTNKKIDVLDAGVSLADRSNMIWMGTFVAGGQCRAIVVSTGEETAFGSIAKDIGVIKKERSHFEKKTSILAKQMGIIAIIGAIITFIVGFYIKGIELEEILFFTIASLVSGIPEGLPAILIMVLALGTTRMAKKNVIIRRLPAAETLGVTTVIMTDKTGTLTRNTMNVREIFFVKEDNVEVTGNGWEPKGSFCRDACNLSPLEEPVLDRLLHISAICNNAKLIQEDSRYKIIGDPTEGSLVVLAEKAGLKGDAMGEKKIDDMPFSSELKYRASLVSMIRSDSKEELYAVGAPESILERSTHYLSKDGKIKLTEKERKIISKKIEEMTSKAMRTIAMSYKVLPLKHGSLTDKLVNEMVFVGVVGIIDPPREEARESVFKARNAGIRVIMTTGDHKGTALAIAKEVGIADEGSEAFSEPELLEMSDKQFKKVVSDVNVFSRLTPSMKLKIAEILQEKGEIVAMTGDGVNDAPSLKKADIGISMGITGTDVARESSEIILADDNFASIINAIEEGRIIFINTRQASTFLITTSFAQYATLIAALLLFSFEGQALLPLLPTQILWLNLVTGGVAGFTLASEPGHGDVLDGPPRKKNENILSKEIIPFLIMLTIIMTTITLSFFSYHLNINGDINKARTAAFLAIASTQLFNVLNMRSMTQSIFEIGLFSNKYLAYSLGSTIILQVIAIYYLQPIFNFGALGYQEVIPIVLASSLVLWAGEIYKKIRYKVIEK